MAFVVAVPEATAEHLVLLSGGIDSACLLADCRAQGHSVSGLFVEYGQAGAAKERDSSASLAKHFNARWKELRVDGLNPSTGEILGRNSLLIHLALTSLDHLRPTCIYLGIHSGTPYLDCTPEFVTDMQRSLDFHSGGQVQLLAPYVTWSKEMVIERARELTVPLELTHSCERSSTPCGHCPSCIDREVLLARA